MRDERMLVHHVARRRMNYRLAFFGKIYKHITYRLVCKNMGNSNAGFISDFGDDP